MYQKFSDFLVESYGKVGSSVLEMVDVVKNDYSNSGVELTNDEALEEVICQAAERMLLDTDAGRRLAEFGKQSAENKSFVEELNDPNANNTAKRAYQLQNIEKYQPTGKSSQKTASSRRPVSAGTIRTVADLFAAVKQKDASFQPKPSSKVVNLDGTPRIMCHGTRAENGDFYIFDESQAKRKGGLGFKALGKGNYFTAKKLDGTERYGSRVIAAYLDIKSPFVYNGGMSFREQVSNDLGIDAESMSYDEIQAVMRQKGYDGVIEYDKAGNVLIAETFDSNQIKSVENMGTFDGANPDIRYRISNVKRATAPVEDGGKVSYRIDGSNVEITSEENEAGVKLASFIEQVNNMIDKAKQSKRKLKIGVITKKHADLLNRIMRKKHPLFDATDYSLWVWHFCCAS